jgi:hypothetical protein
MGYALSTPMLSPQGREVAARDEATGTTKIFEIGDGGYCREVLDLGMPTSKVAWHASARLLAFSVPRQSRELNGEDGIFVFDRVTGTAQRVRSTAGASRFAFPDFLGDRIVLLAPGEGPGGTSVFRVVEMR